MRSDNLAILGDFLVVGWLWGGCGKSWGEYIEEKKMSDTLTLQTTQKQQEKQKKLDEYIDQLNSNTEKKQELDNFFKKYNNNYNNTTLEEFTNLIPNKINEPNAVNDDVDEYAKILYYFLTLKFGSESNFDKIKNTVFFNTNKTYSNEEIIKFIFSKPKTKGGKYRRKSHVQKKTAKKAKKSKKTARRRRK